MGAKNLSLFSSANRAGLARGDRAGRAARRPITHLSVTGVRRGSALLLTLVMALALAALAMSAIYLGSNAQLIAASLDQEHELRYSAEAELAKGKSTLNFDAYAVPDSGYRQIDTSATIVAADGVPVPGITADMYVGPTSSNTGQFGRFVSVVSVARNAMGARVVRRLELAQESFAKFAYWSDQESNGAQTIYFNNNDQLWGPVWSNDIIHIGSGGARFHGDVGTAKTISGASYATFDKGYSQNQKPIKLPTTASLASLAGYASSGKLNFNAPNSGTSSVTQMRIEFVARDLDGDGQLTGADEGFLRVYRANASTPPSWVRGDSTWDNCGAAYVFRTGTPAMFVPLSEHQKYWFKQALSAAPAGYNVSKATSSNATTLVSYVMGLPTARCYLGGDPNLRAVELRGTSRYTTDTAGVRSGAITATNAALDLAGTDTTFVASDAQGQWLTWPGPIDARVQSKWPGQASYLFPLYRGLNSGTKGVIYVAGTTGVSGTLRGKVTLYATGTVTILDDVKYTTDPALNLCADILGVIAANDIVVGDNALQDPLGISGVGYRNMDDTKDVFLQGVLMALHTSFEAENYDQGPTNANGCEGSPNGRGCLYLTGGVIQKMRGPVGLSSGTGFTKRYSYDRCALYNPPPYFPTTGRYTDNRYYEVDPAGFDVAALYRTLTPGP